MSITMEKLGLKKTSLSVEEAAAKFNVGTRTIINYLHSGKLKGKKVGKTWHILPESITEFFGDVPLVGGELHRRVPSSDLRVKGVNLSAFKRTLECSRNVSENSETFGKEVSEKLNSYLHFSLESMISGYFSYGHQKLVMYQQSKDGLCRGLGLLYMHVDEENPVLQSFLEALNATVALIRKIQNEHKKRSREE